MIMAKSQNKQRIIQKYLIELQAFLVSVKQDRDTIVI